MQPTYSDAEIKSAIKRLNDRIKQFYVKDATESEQFYTLLGIPKPKNGIPSKVQKQGVLVDMPKLTSNLSATIGGKRVTFNNVPQLTTVTSVYTIEQIQDIMKYGKKGAKTTAGEAVKTAKKDLKDRGIKNPTKAQIKAQIKANRETHEFIEENKNDIYLVKDLADAVRRKGKLTGEEQQRLLSMYDNPDYRDDNGEFVGDNNGEYLKMGTPT